MAADVAIRHAPDSPEEAAETLCTLVAGGDAVRFVGGETKRTWGAPPSREVAGVSTQSLDRVLEHNAGDMTAVLQAGIPLARAQETFAEAGQMLALDPPNPGGSATVGGVVACADSGPLRHRHGSARDLLLGVRVALPDGTLARAGGRVIKNVAGYDLAKLVYGSQGSLALIAEIVLRLHPLPETSATLVAGASVQQAVDAGQRLLAAPLEPVAIEWLGTGLGDTAGDNAGDRPGRLAVAFEGSPAGVAAQIADSAAILAEAGLDPAVVADRVDGTDGVWAEAAQVRRAGPGQSIALAGTLPGDLEAVAAGLATAARSAGAQADLAAHAALGLHSARLDGTPEAQARCLQQWRDAVLGLGGTLLLQDRPDEVDVALGRIGTDALGPPPSALPLMRAVKRRFDPQSRLAPGRFGEWW